MHADITTSLVSETAKNRGCAAEFGRSGVADVGSGCSSTGVHQNCSNLPVGGGESIDHFWPGGCELIAAEPLMFI